MRAQFASGRESICPVTLNKGTGSLTGAVAGTYYFWLQARNCIGYNAPSTVASVAVIAGDSIEITFPSDCFRSGENWERFAVTFNTTNDSANASLLLEIEAIDGTQTPISLPHTISLTQNSHLAFETSTATLPSNVPEGFIVEYTTKGSLYRYSPNSTALANGEEIITAVPSGNWVVFSETNTFDIYINNTTSSLLGCDVAIEDLQNQYLISQYYSANGADSYFRRIWLYNDTNINVESGKRIGVTVDLQGRDVSTSFTDLLTLVFEGYVPKADPELDIYESDLVTLLPYVGVTQNYTASKSSSLTTPKALLPGVSYQLKVYANFTNADLARNGLIPAYNSEISIIPFLYTGKGVNVGVGAFTGDVILGGDDPNLRRVYPSEGVEVYVDSGSGIVKQFLFENVSPSVVSGLNTNLANQIIAIDGNGTVFSTSTLTANLAQRALVSTLAGESAYSTLSNSVNGDANSLVTITVDFPTAIRANYSDVIAGTTKGTFFAEGITFYIKRTNNNTSAIEYRYFTRSVTPSLTSDTFLLTYNSGTVDTAIPSNAEFGLYTPTTGTIDSVTNVFSAEDYDYEVSYCFVYTGTSITDISHAVADDCIEEITLTLTEVINLSLRDRGEWDSLTVYSRGDLVFDPIDEIWWEATEGSTNISPTPLTPQWQLLSDVSYRLKASATDTVPGYLEDKLIAGTGIILTTMNSGGDEQIRIRTNLETFTGSPASYTPTAAGQLLVKSDVTPNLSYRTTGTTAGAVQLLGAYQTFTGSPASYTPTASGQLLVRTDVTPNLSYRTTGTTAGAMQLLGAYQTFTGSPSSYTPTASGQLLVKSDVTPNTLWRSTGTTAGAVAGIGGGGGGYFFEGTVVVDYGTSSMDVGEIGTDDTDNDSIRTLKFPSAGMGGSLYLDELFQGISPGTFIKLSGKASGAVVYLAAKDLVVSADYELGVVWIGDNGTQLTDGEGLGVSLCGGTGFAVITKTATFTASPTYPTFYLVDCSGGNVVVSLGAASGKASISIKFKRIDSTNSHTLTINRSGTDLIDGATSKSLSVLQYCTLTSDGVSNWWIT